MRIIIISVHILRVVVLNNKLPIPDNYTFHMEMELVQIYSVIPMSNQLQELPWDSKIMARNYRKAM